MASRRRARAGLILRFSLAILLGVLAFEPVRANEQFTGKVIGVSDGDTITILRDRAPVRVRLDGIDCPEGGQDFGQRAKQFTSAAVFGKIGSVDVRGLDRYGRLIARVSSEGRDLSLPIVTAGFAWHYAQYSRDPQLAQAQILARSQRAGLWSEANAVAPWEFRIPTPRAENDATGAGPFHGNVRSGVFHAASCKNFACKNCTRVFPTRDAAVAAGFRPAGDCLR